MHPVPTRASDAAPPALRGDHLSLRYGRHPVVHDVSVRLVPGRVTALVGPNGSGKSTLLRSLARLHPIDDGRLTLGASERSATLLSAKDFAREVTLFAQSRPAPQGLTVREIVAFGRHPYRRAFAGTSAEDRQAVERAMSATGVAPMASRPVGELSGGEMQRVWLATCLAQDTRVVLLDEPTNHLDLRYQVETLDIVRDLVEQHDAAVGIVLHDLDHAARVADEVLLLSDGRIHASGAAVDVLTAPNITAVYDIDVAVAVDPDGGHIRIDPIGRHAARTSADPTRIAPSREDPS
ncbi:ABC transporter ATP-binding protein [Curtobacterium pusillum]|uniref:ABC transporter ATP-binding protein n=1 Tax=Curtobacterium pusillum TaxID=69373 RepID=UPI0011A3D18B|nr:ABC transporter ATP-binding protein [Curtobacterium pusillum]